MVRRALERLRAYDPRMRPLVIMKVAMTIDGQLAAADGTSQWITSPEARRDAHHVRTTVDAVMVGAGTVLADDPRLDVRLDGYDGPQPVPVVVVGRRPLPSTSQVMARSPVVVAPRPVDLPGRVLVAPAAGGERVDLAGGLSLLADAGIERVLVEGGGGLLSALLAAGLIDRGIVYYGSKLAGGTGRPAFTGTWSTLADAQHVQIDEVRMVGGDVRLDFRIDRGPASPG